MFKSVRCKLLTLKLMARKHLASHETLVKAILGASAFFTFIVFVCFLMMGFPDKVENHQNPRSVVIDDLDKRDSIVAELDTFDVKGDINVDNGGREGASAFSANLSFEPDLSVCHGKDVYLLILVLSPPENEHFRKAIRKSWGSGFKGADDTVNQSYLTVFVVGQNNNTDDILMLEIQENKDILLGQFDHSPQHGTKEVILALKWLTKMENVCRPWFILKTVDSMFHNVPLTLKWLAKYVVPPFNVYRGKILRKDKPNRNPKHPNHVPVAKYPKESYPDFIQGPVYLFSYDVIIRLMAAVAKVHPIETEDAYVGILAEKAGILPKNEENFSLMKKTSNDCLNIKLMFIYDVAPNDHVTLFKLVGREDKLHHCQTVQQKDGL